METKANMLAQEWDRRWAVIEEQNERKSQRAETRRLVDDRKAEGKQEAEDRTDDAKAELEALGSLLASRLDDPVIIEWESRKDRSPFQEAEPQRPSPKPTPVRGSGSARPVMAEFLPKLGWVDKLLKSRGLKRIAEGEARFNAAMFHWEKEQSDLAAGHRTAVEMHREAEERRLNAYETVHAAWVHKRNEHNARQAEQHLSIDRERTAWLARDPEAIVAFCDYVLTDSPYPDSLDIHFELDYDPGSKTLLIQAALPTPDDIPRLKAVKYIVTRDDFDESYISEAEALRIYDTVIYQIALRSLYEVFEADIHDAIDAILFNGIVETIDKRTGEDITPCILSLRAGKDDIRKLNLRQVEPKECFRALKGISSAKLSNMVAVAPVMQWVREDSRFVDSYGVAENLDEGVNLAAMDWEDFEHLIRQVFEMEFAANGGEVNITQSSRDGGVDAVVFDPDPLRGGKFVVQAKCYTNTVNVSAVRDLYGTVIHEKAIKGILVTTSNFGKDSYDFATGKPIMLIDGQNLLHLLEKHNYKARIDLRDAKAQKRAMMAT